MSAILPFVTSVLLFGLIARSEAQISYTGLVPTDSGSVVGEYLHTVTKSIKYASFRGIPYAEAPLGYLRFQPPVRKQPWKGLWNATSDANQCIQVNDGNVVGSEDCLYLNVYTPIANATGSQSKAVMVWIHGGSFDSGNGSSNNYGPDFLLEKDVVVVSLQYRLGPFGFLNLNHPAASGNYGLKDQVLALQWVQRNIHQFFGDPKRVTLMGHSSGGVAVDLHQLSNMSSGLFKQTISMSASPLCLYWAFQSNVEAIGQAFLLGTKLGLQRNNTEELLSLLYNTPAETIVKEAKRLPMLPFRPSLERTDILPNQPKFLTECIPKKYREGRYNKVSHMMGFLANEMASLTKNAEDLMKLQHYVINILKYIPVPPIPEILSSLQITATQSRVALYLLLTKLSNIFFVTGIDKKQQLLSIHNENPIYYYRMVFNPDYSIHKSNGMKYFDETTHEDDSIYLFYRPSFSVPIYDPKIANARDKIITMWTNFAKYGNPTPDGPKDPLLGITWPDSRLTDGAHLEIGDSLTIKDRPTNLFIRFYQFIGLGDSNIYNECLKGAIPTMINSLSNIPGTIKSFMRNPNGVMNVLSNIFG